MERKAIENDFEALYEIYMDPTNNPFLLYELMDRDMFLPIFREMLASGEHYVYEQDGKVAASYRVTRKQHRLSHIAYLGSFAVHPAFKSKGVGKRVVLDLAERLRKEGLKRLELLVVIDNHKAIDFYKSLGFEVEGLLKKFLKRKSSDEYVDELAMAMMLG